MRQILEEMTSIMRKQGLQMDLQDVSQNFMLLPYTHIWLTILCNPTITLSQVNLNMPASGSTSPDGTFTGTGYVGGVLGPDGKPYVTVSSGQITDNTPAAIRPSPTPSHVTFLNLDQMLRELFMDKTMFRDLKI